MTQESQALDPYEVVLSDLRAKRDKIDQAIQAILDLRGGGESGATLPSSAQKQEKQPHPNDDVTGPGAFLGMTIVDAAKKLLAAKRKPIGNVEFAAAFKAGGMGMTSTDPVNTIGSVLTRRFNNVGDVVKIGRGTWGLAEWYPGRNFKRKQQKAEPADDGQAAPETLQDKLDAHTKAKVEAARGISIETRKPVDLADVGGDDPWAPIDGPKKGVFS